MEPVPANAVALIATFSALLGGGLVAFWFQEFGPKPEPKKPEPPKGEPWHMIPKEVITLQPDAVADFIHSNQHVITLEHCVLAMMALPDRQHQMTRLHTMLGEAVHALPGRAYVVRLGCR